ncbi:MAG: hypothetical protein DBY32_02260 [Phascolarctobacterium sp.]|nr:MAG: hypothetical protein DBY32_02260 [Phascolarctobacterium sp.]
MQRIAIIDIGSNSARLVITHIYKNGAYNMVYNQKEALRLSQKVDKNGCLTPQAFSDTIETLKTFAYMCKLYNADHIIAVATAAIRNAKNGAELTRLVQKETGINLHIITGNTEAYYSYLGVINTLPYESGIIFDLGGGSTELIYFEERKILESVSVPIGAVNTTAMFNTRGSVNAATFGELCAYLRRRLGEYPWLKQPKLPLIGVGGTARTIGKIHQRASGYPTTKIHNYKLTVQAFRGILNRLKNTTLEERRKISGLSSERADIIIAGASIINALFEVTGSKQLITSGCGLREGLFFDYHSKETGIPLIAEDILERSTEKILTLYTPDPTHSRHITDLALQMFDSWHALHRLNKNFRRLLKTASLLHDIGITINFYSHARHSAYMIQNAQLFGLTHKEQLMTSAVAGWHNGVSKSYFYRDQLFQTMLTENNWQAVNKLALILALAESLDYTQSSLLAIKRAGADKNGAYLTLTASGNAAIEMHQIRTHLKWFAKTFGMPLDIKIEEE